MLNGARGAWLGEANPGARDWDSLSKMMVIGDQECIVPGRREQQAKGVWGLLGAAEGPPMASPPRTTAGDRAVRVYTRLLEPLE